MRKRSFEITINLVEDDDESVDFDSEMTDVCDAVGVALEDVGSVAYVAGPTNISDWEE